jgi:hypothetical protein
MIELIKNEKSLAFISYIKKVIGINYYSLAYSNLMGFTVYGNDIQFKNYYELKEIPSDEMLSEFLPEIESFKMVSQFWDNSIKSSLALGLKLDKNETRYFHVKFGKKTPFVMMPKPPILIGLLEYKHPDGGISYEYTKKKVVKKYYLYIEDKNDMEKVLAFTKMEANVLELECLECYYTDDKDFKVNLIYESPKFTKPDLGHLGEETNKTYKKVVEFLLEHNKPVWYVGKTKSGKVSVYFTATDDKDFIEKL